MSCCYCVAQSDAAVIEHCGRFKEVRGPGFVCLNPCTEAVAGTVSLRLVEHNCAVDSKTKDNVFVTLRVAVQYQALPDYVTSAFYSLQNPVKLIEAYVSNVIRARIPMYDIDALYAERATIARHLKEEVDAEMEQYGFDIINALITSIDLVPQLTQIMDRIMVAERLKMAVQDAAETKKLKIIRKAEADAEAKRLSGIGLAEQRKAIVSGLQQSISTFQANVNELSPDEVMSLLLLNQYFDTLQAVVKAGGESTMALQHNADLGTLFDQMMREAFGAASDKTSGKKLRSD